MSIVLKGTLNTFTNGTLIKRDNYSYIKYTQNGTITCPVNTTYDILIIGAGGNGGYNSSSNFYGGGGGAGEVIYSSNNSLNSNTYNIIIGSNSVDINNRISKLTNSSGTEIIKAKGGGDGGGIILYNTQSNTTYTFSTGVTISYNDDSTSSESLVAGTYTFKQQAGLISINDSIKHYYTLPGTSYNWYKFDHNLPTLSPFSDTGTTITKTNAVIWERNPYNGSYEAATADHRVFTTENPFGLTGIGPLDNDYHLVLPNSINFYNASLKLEISFWFSGSTTTANTTINLFKTKRTWVQYTVNHTLEVSIKIVTGSSLTDNESIVITCKYTILGFNSVNTKTNLKLFNDGKWHNIILQLDYTDVYPNPKYYNIYIDSVKIDTTYINYFNFEEDDPLISYTTTTTIGNREEDTKNYKLYMHDFRIKYTFYTLDEINLIYNARAKIVVLPKTGGSGGGGGGGSTIQTKALAGTSAGTSTYSISKRNNGYDGIISKGGDGGSAESLDIGYTEIISGDNLVVSKGGTGGSSSTVPATKINFGDGGDGNNGQGYQGIVILKILENGISQCLSDVQSVFGGENPIKLSEYYNGGSYVFKNFIIPSNNKISLGNFRCVSKVEPINVFTTNGTFTAQSDLNCEILLVAGGGRGGWSQIFNPNSTAVVGGGGGAGGIISLNITIPKGKYDIIVGLGGTINSGNGGNSRIIVNNFTYEAIGGGSGGGVLHNGSYYYTHSKNGSNGGNGGGASWVSGSTTITTTAGIAVQPYINITHYNGVDDSQTGEGSFVMKHGGNGGGTSYSSTISGTTQTYSRPGLGENKYYNNSVFSNPSLSGICYGDGGCSNTNSTLNTFKGKDGIVIIKILP